VLEAERLRTENAGLVQRLVQTKEREINRMNEINKERELMVGHSRIRMV
jgi:hypothetical protein